MVHFWIRAAQVLPWFGLTLSQFLDVNIDLEALRNAGVHVVLDKIFSPLNHRLSFKSMRTIQIDDLLRAILRTNYHSAFLQVLHNDERTIKSRLSLRRFWLGIHANKNPSTYRKLVSKSSPRGHLLTPSLILPFEVVVLDDSTHGLWDFSFSFKKANDLIS